MATATAPSPGSFVHHGFAELGRRLARRRLRAQLKQHAAARHKALVELGRSAWTQGVDLARWPDLRDQLAQTAAQAGVVSQTSERLAREQQSLEAERRSTAERFDAERRALDQRRQPVDHAARAAKQARAAGEAAVARTQAQLAALAGKLAGVAAGSPESAALLAEQQTLTADVEHARAALPAQVLEDTRLDGEAKALAAEVAALETRRREALASLDRRLAEVRKATHGATKEAGALKSGEEALCARLGEALQVAAASGGAPQPLLAPAFAGLHQVDRARAGTEAELAASQATTDRMPAGAMSMFWSLVVIGVLLLVALVAGTWWWQQHRQARSEAVVARTTPAAAAPTTPTTPTTAPAPGTCTEQSPPVQGAGVAVFRDCTRWEGEFLERRLHGPGRKLYASGERLEGHFWNGYLDGPGVAVRPDGSRREGSFTGGRLFGPGKLVQPDGTVWQGVFWANNVVGYASRRTPDGVVIAGQWRQVDGRPLPIGNMLRIGADGKRERVEATTLEPRMAQIVAQAASQPVAKDPSAY